MEREVYDMDLVTDDRIPTHLDCFIIAAGADYRSYENLEKLVSLGCDIRKLIVFDFTQRHVQDDIEYSSSYSKFEEIYEGDTINIETDISDPTTCIPNLTKKTKIESNYNIGLDISCFTKPYFYVLLKYLAYINLDQLLVFYTQPRTYRFSDGSYCSFRSSSGPISVREVPSFPGSDDRNDERMLIVLLGFDGDLSSEISEIVAPTKTVIVNGFPSFETKFKDISLINNEKLVNNSSKLLYSKSTNPFEIYNTLKELVSMNNDAAINIAPLGNKPMALGACLFAIHNPQVRIIYPYPEKYTNVTTDSCSISWVYKIPLHVKI